MILLHGPDPNISPVSVCQVSNADGDIEVTMVAEQSPFSQDALQSSMCFILDNGANGHIFVWKGSNFVLLKPDWLRLGLNHVDHSEPGSDVHRTGQGLFCPPVCVCVQVRMRSVRSGRRL